MRKWFLLLSLTIYLPALGQKREDKRTFDSWTVGLRQNMSTGLPDGYTSKPRLTFQGGLLKKNYYVLGESNFTIRTGLLAVIRSAAIESAGQVYSATRYFADIPLTINYPYSRYVDVHFGAIAAVKLSSSASGPPGFTLDEESVAMLIPTVGFDYDLDGWRLGFFVESAVAFSRDWKQSALGFTGKFPL